MFCIMCVQCSYVLHTICNVVFNARYCDDEQFVVCLACTKNQPHLHRSWPIIHGMSHHHIRREKNQLKFFIKISLCFKFSSFRWRKKIKQFFATCNQQKQQRKKNPTSITITATKECNIKQEINCDANTMMVFNENYTSLNYSRERCKCNSGRTVCANLFSFFPFFVWWVACSLFSFYSPCVLIFLHLSFPFQILSFIYLFLCHAATHAALVATFMTANFSLLRISCGCSSNLCTTLHIVVFPFDRFIFPLKMLYRFSCYACVLHFMRS